MSWSAPRSWVVGEMASAALLNAHIRDNLAYLGTTHRHGTATGDGSTVINPQIIRLENQVDQPASRELRRGSADAAAIGSHLKWGAGAAVVVVTTSDVGAATASLRTLGAGGTQAAAGNHTH